MPPVCTVCRSPNRRALDAVLTDGRFSLRVIARQEISAGIGRSALHRHSINCLQLVAPGDRLRAMADRTALAAIAADTLTRAQELLDDAEARGDRRGTATALTAVLRAVETADRTFPADAGFTDDEVKGLLLTVAEDVDDPVARKTITAGLRARDAADLATVLDQVWARRAALDARQTTKEIA